MKTPKFPELLDWVMQDRVPAHVNLSDRVMKKAASRPLRTLNPQLRAASIILALAALIFVSSVGFAIYRLVLDPGLQAVQNAGLVSTQGATALPTLEATSEPSVPPQAVTVAQSQTIESVTLTLNWVYLDSTRFLSGLSFDALPEGISPGFPVVTVDGQPLASDQQPVQYLRTTATDALFLSNQVTQLKEHQQTAALEISVPLVRREDGVDVQVAVFLFQVGNVPLYPGQTLPYQQTAAVRVDGTEIQLHSVRLTPGRLEVVVCPSPVSSIPLNVEQASLSVTGAPERSMTANAPLMDAPACRRLDFDAQGLTTASSLTLTVNQDWSFSIDQPQVDQIPGVIAVSPKPSATPVAVSSIDRLNITLDWVFADARRIAFGYTVSGFSSLPDALILGGTIEVRDGQGQAFGSRGGQSTLQRVPDQPDALTGTWSTILQQPMTTDQINLAIDITLDGTHGNDWNHTIGGPVYPLSGPTEEMISTMPAVVPSNLVGTYHFSATTKVYPVAVLQPAQIIEVNSIQMELVQAELTPSYSNFILCYNKPTGADWMLSNAVLTSGLEQTQLQSYTLLSDAQYALKKPATTIPSTTIQGDHLRCASVDFLLGHANHAGTITLTIPSLERSAPEIFPQAELDAAFAILKQEGIEMRYVSMQGTGGGGSTWKYDKLPEGMTERQAYDRLFDELGYRSPGPWVFTFEYKP